MATAKSLTKKPKKKVVKGAPRLKRGAKLTGPSFADFDKLSGYEFHRLRQQAVEFYYQNYKTSDGWNKSSTLRKIFLVLGKDK